MNRRDMTKQDWALWSANLGFRIVPLYGTNERGMCECRDGWTCQSPGKHPRISYWPKFTSKDPDQIGQWWAQNPNSNIGRATGDDVFALDLDVKNDGVENFCKLVGLSETDFQELLVSTASTRTWSGGYHLFFKADKLYSNGTGLGTDLIKAACGEDGLVNSGIDLRGYNGQCVAPGSMIGDKRYELVTDLPPQEQPEIIQLFMNQNAESTRPKTRSTESLAARIGSTKNPVNDEDRVDRYISWLESQEPILEGGRNDSVAKRLAPRAYDLGITPDLAADLIHDYAPIEGLDFDADEIRRATYSGMNSCDGVFGDDGQSYRNSQSVLTVCEKELIEDLAANDNLFSQCDPTPGSDFRIPTEDDSEDGPLSAAELVQGDFPRVEHIWQNLLLKDHVNLLYGDGGTGKTLLSLQVAVAVASGKSLFGKEVKQMPALMVLCEDNYGEIKYRLEQICRHVGVNLADLPIKIWCRPGRDNILASVNDVGEDRKDKFYGLLTKQIGEIGKPCLVVLDTAADLAVLDENKRQPVNTFCKSVLGGICQQYDSTILLNAHPSKASMEDGSHYAGSTAWNNAVRQRLVLKVDKETRLKKLMVAKSNYGVITELELTFANDVFVTTDERYHQDKANFERYCVGSTVGELADQRTYIVRSVGSGQKPRDVARAVNAEFHISITAKQVSDYLGDLERNGVLVYEGADNRVRGHRAGFRKGPNFDAWMAAQNQRNDNKYAL